MSQYLLSSSLLVYLLHINLIHLVKYIWFNVSCMFARIFLFLFIFPLFSSTSLVWYHMIRNFGKHASNRKGTRKSFTSAAVVGGFFQFRISIEEICGTKFVRKTRKKFKLTFTQIKVSLFFSSSSCVPSLTLQCPEVLLCLQASVIHSSSDSRLPSTINIFKLQSSTLPPDDDAKKEIKAAVNYYLFQVYEKVCDISSTSKQHKVVCWANNGNEEMKRAGHAHDTTQNSQLPRE